MTLVINNSSTFRVTIYLSPFNPFLTSLNPITYSVHLCSLWDHTPQFFLFQSIFRMYYLYYTPAMYSKFYQIDATDALSAH